MRQIGHFIGGKEVAGTSGRTGDVFNPNTGEVQAKVAFAKRRRSSMRSRTRRRRSPAWAATNPQRRARVLFKFLELVQKEFDSLAMLLSSEHGKTIADCKGDIQRGLEVVEFACGIPHLHEGRIHRKRRPRHRPVFDPPAAGRGRRHHAVQFPGHDPDVEVRPGARLRQRLHPQAVRTRSVGADAACRTAGRGRPAGGRAQRRQRRQGSGGHAAHRPAHQGGRISSARRRSPSTSMPPARRTANACSVSAAPRTT